LVKKVENNAVPGSYADSRDTTNTADIRWREFFTDPYLVALIDTALANNQELNIVLQEIEISRNEIRARKGEYLPFVNVGVGAGVEKVGRYTHQGASDAATEYEPGKEMPDPLQDYFVGALASWEVDIWHKLRNAKKSAIFEYLSTREGKNFMVTQLISEIANSYYELIALDNQLGILNRNIDIQRDALGIVRMQKAAARVTELPVRKFEAEVLKNRSRQYYIQQRIVETENRINFLIGRFPQRVMRNSEGFTHLLPEVIQEGIPSQLLENRTDIRQAELELEAAKLDVKVAKANFYPSLDISAAIGLQAFKPSFLVKAPESVLYSLAGDVAAPLVNRNAIKATYYSANARQIQAAFNYERTILNAYIEVQNQLSKISNLEKSYDLKEQEVEALTQSITIYHNHIKSARADYMEVLMTQRDALESRFELIETRKEQMNAMVDIYQALGGGWE
jgi:NodT family efflux transporter outer membrane factor (OMF) lipoprotein